MLGGRKKRRRRGAKGEEWGRAVGVPRAVGCPWGALRGSPNPGPVRPFVRPPSPRSAARSSCPAALLPSFSPPLLPSFPSCAPTKTLFLPRVTPSRARALGTASSEGTRAGQPGGGAPIAPAAWSSGGGCCCLKAAAFAGNVRWEVARGSGFVQGAAAVACFLKTQRGEVLGLWAGAGSLRASSLRRRVTVFIYNSRGDV